MRVFYLFGIDYLITNIRLHFNKIDMKPIDFEITRRLLLALIKLARREQENGSIEYGDCFTPNQIR